MIEYVVKTNIDDRIISKAKNILLNGGVVAYPTDTTWAIGCSSNSKNAIKRLIEYKGDLKSYTLTLTCSSISQISEIAELNNANFRFIKKYTPGPFVFILPTLNSFEKKVNMKRPEVGIRIPNNPIPMRLAEAIGVPMFSITASKKMTDKGWWDTKFAEENLFEASYELEEIPHLDMIIDIGEELSKVLTTVIDLTKNEPIIIRAGIGKI